MKYYWRYWSARFRNELRQLTLRPLKEKDVVGEIMGKLYLNPTFRKLLEETKAKMNAEDKEARHG